MIASKIYSKYLIPPLLFLLLLMLSSITSANTFADIDIGIINDDNLSRSDYGPDKKADTAVEVFVDYGKFYDLNNNWSATASVFSQYTNHLDFNKLSTLGIGIAGSIRKKLGLGAYSSSIQTSVSITSNNVNDTKRNSKALDISIGWDKRLNDTWELSAGISLNNTDATNKVFDTKGTSVFISSDYTFSEKLLLSFGLSQRTGDIITVTNALTNPNKNNLILASGDNNISDTVFGAGLTAYRVDATTLIIKFALSYALNDDSSINAGFEHQDSALAYGINYKNNILRANYIYSF